MGIKYKFKSLKINERRKRTLKKLETVI